jgi:hypothetical protein
MSRAVSDICRIFVATVTSDQGIQHVPSSLDCCQTPFSAESTSYKLGNFRCGRDLKEVAEWTACINKISWTMGKTVVKVCTIVTIRMTLLLALSVSRQETACGPQGRVVMYCFCSTAA